MLLKLYVIRQCNRQLTGAPYMMMVDWSKWHVFFADERAVGKRHPESNYKLTKDVFLSKVKEESCNVNFNFNCKYLSG